MFIYNPPLFLKKIYPCKFFLSLPFLSHFLPFPLFSLALPSAYLLPLQACARAAYVRVIDKPSTIIREINKLIDHYSLELVMIENGCSGRKIGVWEGGSCLENLSMRRCRDADVIGIGETEGRWYN